MKIKTAPPQSTTIFRALSDRTRLRILNLLQGGELCVCHLVARSGTCRSPRPPGTWPICGRPDWWLPGKKGCGCTTACRRCIASLHAMLLECLAQCFRGRGCFRQRQRTASKRYRFLRQLNFFASIIRLGEYNTVQTPIRKRRDHVRVHHASGSIEVRIGRQERPFHQALGVQAVAEAFGYTPEQLASIPAEANMGLSCGNPTAFASLKPGETVVDLGCGGGLDVFLAAKRVGPTGKAIGIDMTPEMLELARRNAAKADGGKPLANVEFHQATIDRLPLPDASVDCVISNCVINLAPDKQAVFREIARVLKPGGGWLSATSP